mgnify:CR=1 FL=1
MLIPSAKDYTATTEPSLSRRVNANSQPQKEIPFHIAKLIKKGEC